MNNSEKKPIAANISRYLLGRSYILIFVHYIMSIRRELRWNFEGSSQMTSNISKSPKNAAAETEPEQAKVAPAASEPADKKPADKKKTSEKKPAQDKKDQPKVD